MMIMTPSDLVPLAQSVPPEVAQSFYNDGLQPGAKELGHSLQTITGLLNVLLLPFAVLVHGMKELENKLKCGLNERFNGTPSEQIISPSLNIAGPLLEKYKYHHDTQEISDMFLNLLANSMDIRRCVEAHPAFVEVISQLMPDEARLLRAIASNPTCPKVDVGIEILSSGGYSILRRNVMSEKDMAGLEHSQLTASYLDNLQRLGLISYTSGSFQERYTDPGLYESILNSSFVTSLSSSLDPALHRIKLVRGSVFMTDFGRSFISAVTRDRASASPA